LRNINFDSISKGTMLAFGFMKKCMFMTKLTETWYFLL
jgi:hypothetical protein